MEAPAALLEARSRDVALALLSGHELYVLVLAKAPGRAGARLQPLVAQLRDALAERGLAFAKTALSSPVKKGAFDDEAVRMLAELARTAPGFAPTPAQMRTRKELVDLACIVHAAEPETPEKRGQRQNNEERRLSALQALCLPPRLAPAAHAAHAAPAAPAAKGADAPAAKEPLPAEAPAAAPAEAGAGAPTAEAAAAVAPAVPGAPVAAEATAAAGAPAAAATAKAGAADAAAARRAERAKLALSLAAADAGLALCDASVFARVGSWNMLADGESRWAEKGAAKIKSLAAIASRERWSACCLQEVPWDARTNVAGVAAGIAEVKKTAALDSDLFFSGGAGAGRDRWQFAGVYVGTGQGPEVGRVGAQAQAKAKAQTPPTSPHLSLLPYPRLPHARAVRGLRVGPPRLGRLGRACDTRDARAGGRQGGR